MSSFLLSVDQIKNAVHGQLLQKQDSFMCGVSTDSRTAQKGDLFIPLVGENFNGHDFLQDVISKQVGCILTAQPLSFQPENVSVIQVQDTLKALQDLAQYYRHAHPFKIIGITGSNGKTTTKFFTHTLLSSRFKTFASQKSFNNHFGVPLTLLSLAPDIEYGICEIGMNHSGEIASLTDIAQPDISLCTTVGRAHLMDFGKVDGIYQEKKDIYTHAPAENFRVFNLDNEWTQKMHAQFKNSHSLTFSKENKKADVSFQAVKMSLNSLHIQGHIQGVEREVEVPVFGSHNITNLMGAAGIALAAQMSPDEIWTQLPQCKTVWGRSQLIDLKSGAHLVFDGYNANPDSVIALIENLAEIQTSAQKIFILGDMKEMGAQAESVHEEVGFKVGEKNFDIVCFTGEYAAAFEKGLKQSGFSKNALVLNSYEDSLAIKIANMIQPHDVVVIKGSRGSKMERFVPHLQPLDARALENK